MQFFFSVSAETDALNTKINVYGDRMGKITKRGNPSEFEAIISGSASDLESYAQRIESLIPEYRRNLESTTDGFEQTIRSLDPSTTTGAQELASMGSEAQKLAETGRGVKAKVANFRKIVEVVRDSNHDPRLTRAANIVVAMTEHLSTTFEDLETLGLKVSFSAARR